MPGPYRPGGQSVNIPRTSDRSRSFHTGESPLRILPPQSWPPEPFEVVGTAQSGLSLRTEAEAPGRVVIELAHLQAPYVGWLEDTTLPDAGALGAVADGYLACLSRTRLAQRLRRNGLPAEGPLRWLPLWPPLGSSGATRPPPGPASWAMPVQGGACLPASVALVKSGAPGEICVPLVVAAQDGWFQVTIRGLTARLYHPDARRPEVIPMTQRRRLH